MLYIEQASIIYLMFNLLVWLLIYTFTLAMSQILLKKGLTQIGTFSAHNIVDLFNLLVAVLKNPYVVGGTALMASSYFLWLAILSHFKLSIAFPLTAIGFIFVALLSYFILGERLLWHNYLGIGFIALGIFLLLFNTGKIN